MERKQFSEAIITKNYGDHLFNIGDKVYFVEKLDEENFVVAREEGEMTQIVRNTELIWSK